MTTKTLIFLLTFPTRIPLNYNKLCVPFVDYILRKVPIILIKKALLIQRQKCNPKPNFLMTSDFPLNTSS